MQAKLPLKSLPEMSNFRKMDSHTNIMKTVGRGFAPWKGNTYHSRTKKNCLLCESQANSRYQSQLFNVYFSSNNGSTVEESLYEFFHPHLKLRNPKKKVLFFFKILLTQSQFYGTKDLLNVTSL